MKYVARVVAVAAFVLAVLSTFVAVVNLEDPQTVERILTAGTAGGVAVGLYLVGKRLWASSSDRPVSDT